MKIICNLPRNNSKFPLIHIFPGDQGALLLEKGQIEGHHFKVRPEENVVSVSGAGDCLAAGFIAGLLKGYDNITSVNMGLKSARLSLQSFYTVPESLSFKSIQ